MFVMIITTHQIIVMSTFDEGLQQVRSNQDDDLLNDMCVGGLMMLMLMMITPSSNNGVL